MKSVIKATGFKGETIRVWEAPAYNEESSKHYHETGESESPLLQIYQPKHAPLAKEEKILFLMPNHSGENYFYYLGQEGKGSLETIKALIKKK